MLLSTYVHSKHILSITKFLHQSNRMQVRQRHGLFFFFSTTREKIFVKTRKYIMLVQIV